MITIDNMQAVHWAAVRKIYEQGIQTGHATFEPQCPSWDQWDSAHLQDSRLVATNETGIIGWAALSPVSGRCVYAGVAEVSVYVDVSFSGAGIGTQLLKELVSSSERQQIWTLQAGIFPENLASIRIHEKAGFRVVGTREKIGQMPDGTWRNVVLMERRSNKF